MKNLADTPCFSAEETPVCKPPQRPASEKPVIGVTELAKRWGVDQKTIREAINLGQLPSFRIGRRRVLIPLAAVESMEQGRGLPPEESWR